MKVKLLILALVLAAMSACTQRTCPTYAKHGDNTSSELAKN